MNIKADNYYNYYCRKLILFLFVDNNCFQLYTELHNLVIRSFSWMDDEFHIYYGSYQVPISIDLITKYHRIEVSLVIR